MKCIKCGVSCFDKMLHRTNAIGVEDAGWMCMSCIEKHEPELAKNLKGEKDFEVVKFIENIIVSDNHKGAAMTNGEKKLWRILNKYGFSEWRKTRKCLLSDLTALISEGYYPKEFVEWLIEHPEHGGMIERGYIYWKENEQ